MNTKILFALLLACSATSYAEQIVSSGDGKKYRLNDDGSWEPVSEDRYLDTDDGRRVVLKTDGRWQYVGLTPKKEKSKFQSLSIAAKIDTIKIDETRESVGGGKNTRVSAHIIAKLNVTLAETASQALDLSRLKRFDFIIKDNRGKRYVLSELQASEQRLQPGASTTLLLKTKKAPKRFRKIAELIVEINEAALGNNEKISLEYNYAKVKRNVHTK